ncbi:GAF domain-containing protein [Hydrocarboniphaga sp.]|uniref:GAF domain-containing protein n=1 Tax=Hydrocarboniphaga sp. TaxID=2033016 RepID=UPI003D0A5E88
MLSGRWLGLHLLAMLLLSLCWGIGVWQTDREHHERDAVEDTARLDRAEHLLGDRLGATVGELRFLSHTSEVQALLADAAPANRERAAALFAELLRDKPRYAGVRLFDDQGRLLVRVDRRANAILINDAAALQRQQDRDVFDATRILPPDAVYLSRFELAVEGGQLALPRRSVLRAATPLRRGEQAAQVLELEQDGARLLGSLTDTLATAGAEGMLIDDLGYWIFHPDETRRWGAQIGFGDSMARAYPQTWSSMQGARGQIGNDEGRWIYRPVFPFRDLPGVSGPVANRGWWLAMRHPPASAGFVARIVGSAWFWAAQALLLTTSLLLAFQLARIDSRRARNEAALALAEQQAAAQRRVRELVYQLSLQIQSANSAAMFGQLLLGELAPLLQLSVGALYRLDGPWLRAIAGYGLPDVTLRQFRVGEGLISEALADHRRIELDRLPADYLLVRSALGHASPTHLLIVPLWLRAENLGVLELGLNAPLDAVARDVLGQSLPLIALHLANYAHRPTPA